MLKLEIKLVTISTDKECAATIDNIYLTLDRLFEKYCFKIHILDDGTHCYYGNGDPGDYGIFGRIITTLKNKVWFVDHACKWLWYNSDDSDNEDDYSVEDVLYHYTKRKSVA